MAFSVDADKQSEIWAGTIVLTVAATIAVVCRLIARRVSSAVFWGDDSILVLSLLLNFCMNGIRWAQVKSWGYGRHAEILTESNIENFWKSFLAVQIVYFANSVATKTSLLLLFYRLFGVAKNFRLALYATTFLVWSYFVGCTIVAVWGCHPVSYFWYKSQPGWCINETSFFRWNGIANLLIDVLVLCLPMPMVWKLKVNIRQKLGLSGIFMLGGFVCAASIIRVIAFKDVSVKDPTYTTINTATWSSVEQSLGIVCACLPTLRPLIGQIISNGRSSCGRNTVRISQSQSKKHASGDLIPPISTRNPSYDNESMVGFAKVPEEVYMEASPRNGFNGEAYEPVGVAISSNASRGNDEGIRTIGILKTSEIEQKGDDLPGR